MGPALDLTQYCWTLRRVFPHRIRFYLHTVPGFESELARRLVSRGLHLRRKGAGTLVADRPGEVVAAAELIGATPGLVKALRAYANAWSFGQRGIKTDPELQLRRETAAAAVESLTPTPRN